MPRSRPALLPRRALRPVDFKHSSDELAQHLIGCKLVRVLEGGVRVAGRIVETEAYLGVRDRAAHSYGGRRTERNEAMYARAGTAYVYFTYGMHHCFNVVCGEVDEPVAVLVRALEPVEGIDRMHAERGRRRDGSARKDTDLCSGPGKLCRALAIDRDLNGIDLTSDGRLFVESSRDGPIEPARLSKTARVGVDYAGAWSRRRLRWYLTDSPHVSRPRG